MIVEEQLRVTKVSYSSSKLTIFNGVPIQKDPYRINSGKYFISVRVDTEHLPVTPAIGQHWIVKGKRTFHDVTVESTNHVMKQHLFDTPESLQCSLPEDGEQIIRFIANEKDFKGIGESKARALWNHLGRRFHQTLSNDTPESREALRGVLSEDSIGALFEGYKKYKALRYANWMTMRGIPASIQQRLLKHHDVKTVDAIQQNPYLLIGFGMSFADVDALVADKRFEVVNNPRFEIAPDDDKRLSAALEMAIRKEIDKGHTYTTAQAIKPWLIKLLNDEVLVEQAFKAGHNKAQYIFNPETQTYHPTAQWLMEQVVAKRLYHLFSQVSQSDTWGNSLAAISDAMAELPYKLTDKQQLAVTTSVKHAVSCITGGAGTGKTTVLRTALKAYKKLGYEIHAVALSGRAAMRLHESIGFKTRTIAGMLNQDYIEPDEEYPLHLLVIDEASMIDLPTMYRIVNHIHPDVRIIFAGDPDQLPPIGCGKVLADIVSSGVIANTTLDIVKRQEGATGIPEYSKTINDGCVPDNLTTGNIHFHETPKADIAKRCCELYQKSPENSRVMAPTKALVTEINKLTQEAVNPNGRRLEFELNGERLFLNMRVNDAILFTQSHYAKGIQNGSLGTLTSVQVSDGKYGEVTLDTGDTLEITESVLDGLELGYAITLHKAQGSQFPRVIIALSKGRIVDRAWLYTAITRAEAEVHVVGSIDDMRRVIEAVSHSHKRNSFLHTLLMNFEQQLS